MYILIGGYIIAIIFYSRSDSVSKDLYEFISMNSERLQNGETIDYLGSPINKETKLVRYRYCFSYFIATSTRNSGLYIIGSSQALKGRLICILISFLVGWWGFPWGFIRTIQCLFVDTVKNGDLADTVEGILKGLYADTEPIFSNIVR